VSAPVFLVDALPAADMAVLEGSEGHHAAAVRRVRPGERVDLADGVGGVAVCSVAEVERDRVRLSVLRREQVPLASPRLTVVQALAKGERGELAVELLTEVGVDAIVPWAAERAVVQWRGERGERALGRWRSTAREAAKQARRAWVPTVEPLQTTAELAHRVAAAPEAPGRTPAACCALVLHEEADLPLSTVDLPADGEIVVVVGPEGGVSPAELDVLSDAGARPVRLGPAVLRTSTAGAAALSVLSARLRRW